MEVELYCELNKSSPVKGGWRGHGVQVDTMTTLYDLDTFSCKENFTLIMHETAKPPHSCTSNKI